MAPCPEAAGLLPRVAPPGRARAAAATRQVGPARMASRGMSPGLQAGGCAPNHPPTPSPHFQPPHISIHSAAPACSVVRFCYVRGRAVSYCQPPLPGVAVGGADVAVGGTVVAVAMGLTGSAVLVGVGALIAVGVRRARPLV